MKIAICGIRGIPACYGGFETFAEELGKRLVERGHEVTVYGRRHVIKHDSSSYLGMRLVLLPACQHKYLETPLHTLLCLLHIIFLARVDVLLVCNAANSPFLWLTRLGLIPTAVNVDGIERKRAKWNALGRLWYRFGEICSVIFARTLVSDAQVIREYYLDAYKADSEVIPYGYVESLRTGEKVKFDQFRFTSPTETALFAELGVEPFKYFLYVSRLEPENNAHVVLEAYRLLRANLKSPYPLVIVGDAPYAAAYKERLHSLAGPGVVFAGYRFGDAYQSLQLGAFCYIQATEVGGTHPALVESMGFGNCVLANSTPENKEVLGESGLFYAKNDSGSLASLMLKVHRDSFLVKEKQYKARQRAEEQYSWESVTDSYEKLFGFLAKKI